MRIHGTLKKWNDERGFGFIECPSQDKEIFVHISAFPHDGGRPKVGETISFEIRSGSDGKTRAVAVQRPGGVATNRRPKRTVTSSKPGKAALAPVLLFIGLLCFAGYRFLNSPQSVTVTGPVLNSSQRGQTESHSFTCDGRQHCSEMRSRAEAEFFIRNCPNTKMDGDNDGIPCENDSRF
ncbi:MAG: cold shock domain-containing protein [Cellvibrionaceae bacterium]|nr:cold shock domain-containing protein [Cellvibrionaceae bacterium]